MKLYDPEHYRFLVNDCLRSGEGINPQDWEQEIGIESGIFDDRLKPTETYLHMHQAFIDACIASDTFTLNDYCMGWQL